MAQREGQGLQIAVICFAMLTIILAITTYVFYAQSQTAQKDLDAKTKALSEKQNEANKLKYRVKAMQYVLGGKDTALQDVQLAEQTAGGADPEAKEVLENFDKDIALVGEQAVPEGPRSYRTLVSVLLTALNRKNASMSDAIGESRNAQQERERADLAAKARADAAEATSTKAAADYKGETDQFLAFRTKMEEDKKQISDQLAAGTTRFKSDLQKVIDEKEIFVKQNAQLQAVNNAYRQRNEAEDKEKKSLFENPDGEIRLVNQRQRMVWINLGRKDGLLRQTTFSVYDHDENGVASAKPKGRIEVVNVNDPLSEARILEDTPSNPIINGDVIFTPAWSPGQRIHFALAMKMDINKDQIDDYEMVKNIIQLNGGVIDAELRPDGTRVGNITVNTRYFVEGEQASELTSEEIRNKFTAFDGDRERLGVAKISVEEFLAMMGWKAEERTVELAGPRTGGDFRKARAKTQPAAKQAASESATPAADAPTTPAPAAGGADPFGAPAARAPAADPFSSPPAGKATPPAEADPFAAPR